MFFFTSKLFTRWWCCFIASTSVAYVALASEASGGNIPYPAVTLVEQTVLTTAKQDFRGHGQAFELATKWNEGRLRAGQDERRAPHLACAEYGRGNEAGSGLQTFLSPDAVKPVHHSSEHGVCFMATASDAQAAELSTGRAGVDLMSVGPFPSALKIAPGVLEHDGGSASSSERSDELERLTTTHGSKMRMDNVQGLMVELTPGVLPAHSSEAKTFIGDLLEDIMSKSVDLHSDNFWSDPAMLGGEHLAIPEGALRGREWSRAATVVHELSAAAGTTPGDICSWEGVAMHHAANDVLLVSGLDHLLYNGRGAGGQREEAEELHVACFMGLVSILVGRLEVLRVAPWHTQVLFNAAARANIQTATATSTPLTDAGLNGTGEVIQVVDSGLDETSCFFEDSDGLEVTHGHYFEELGLFYNFFYPSAGSSSASTTADFIGGDFSFDIDRRKIVQYINMVKSDSPTSSSSPLQLTSEGRSVYWVPGDSFEQDDPAGHGTHTAGSAAGATLTRPADPVTCSGTDRLSCVGGCIDDDASYSIDDLVPSSYQLAGIIDIDRICPMFGCDDAIYDVCLGGDVSETLTDNGGMAQGAKLAIFDVFIGDSGLSSLVGNGLWEACMDAGCKLHSNSYGADGLCTLSPMELEYDDFMYTNPENLIIFAAGNDGDINDGDINDGRTVCTIGSPGIGKNVLTVGATSSGQTRITVTGEDGNVVDGTNGSADIDTVSFFSSYGPTQDRRIKPEIVAPGDMIYSAASDGTDGHSCRLYAYQGTSMSCPIVAGASAMIRQYFVDSSFYATDVSARGFCDQDFLCEGFSPSSATVKALLINSANLMGRSSEPDGLRGFGRVHLEQGMPLDGEGSLVLFVADAASTFIPELTVQKYVLEVDGQAGLDFRVTLSWIDPAATSLSVKQLVHDLDLAVSSPSGTRYTMWKSGEADDANVNERVIVDALDVESGAWTVSVSANSLTTDFQSYSLVANGAISSVKGNGMDANSSTSGSSFDPGSIPSSFGPDAAPSESSKSLSKSNVKQSSTAATASFLAVLSCYIASTLAAATFRA